LKFEVGGRDNLPFLKLQTSTDKLQHLRLPMNDIDAARALGWASIGIGLTELAGTKYVEEMLGVNDHATLLRAFGLREIASGVGILSQDEPTTALATALWSRVAGDAVDLAMLAAAKKETTRPKGLLSAIAMVAAITAMDVVCAQKIQSQVA
jgi:hypothetical protein